MLKNLNKEHLYIPLVFSLSAIFACAETSQPKNPYLKEFSESGKLKVQFPTLPGREWPMSLISYPVEFSAPGIKAENLKLTGADGKELMFQLSEKRQRNDGTLAFARLNFMADFPANTDRYFVLNKGKNEFNNASLTDEKDERFIVINTNSLKIKVPSTIVKPKSKGPVPVPVLGVKSDDSWKESGLALESDLELTSLNSNRIETGPLFLTHQLTYNFKGGGKYTVTLKCIRDLPRIEISETFQNINPKLSKPFLEEFKDYLNHSPISNGLNEIKDWILAYGGKARPEEDTFLTKRFNGNAHELLLSAYSKSATPFTSLTQTDCIQIAETAYQLPDHPMSNEWFDQSEKALKALRRKSGIYSIESSKIKTLIQYVSSLRKGNIPDKIIIEESLGKLSSGSVAIGKRQGRKIILNSGGELLYPSGKEAVAKGAILTKNPINKESILTAYADLGDVKYGSVTYPYQTSGHRERRALHIQDQYLAIIDHVGNGTAKWMWKDSDTMPPIFVGTDYHQILKTINEKENEMSLEGDASAVSGIGIIGTESNIKVHGKAPRPGLQVSPGPELNAAFIQTNNGIDRIFAGQNGQNKILIGKKWSVDAMTALIREIDNNNIELSVIGGHQNKRHRIASEHMTLDIEGTLASASAKYKIPKQESTRDPVIFQSSGKYSAPDGATLRINFGKPFTAKRKSNNRLLAFWKFDEGKGTQFTNIKNPELKGKLIGKKNEPSWIKGVGFGNGTAISLQKESQINTLFEEDINGSNSISLWVKTKEHGLVLNKTKKENGKFVKHSRTIQITREGKVSVKYYGDNAFEIESKEPVNDGQWHHIAWVTEEESDEGVSDQLANTHTLFIDSKIAGTQLINRKVNDQLLNVPLKLGGQITSKDKNGQINTTTGLNGAIDNLRIYNFPITQTQIHGFTMVGLMRSPLAITSEPQKMIRVGQEFEYAIEYTGGGPFVRFTFNNVPKWAKIEGRIIGTPTLRDLGLSKPITIVGMSPWGPGQQRFSLSVQPPLVKREWKIQVNGRPVLTRYNGLGVEATLPPGKGTWKLTKEKAPLRPPLILKVENLKSGINVQIRGTPGATKYSIESSNDGGKVWSSVSRSTGLKQVILPLKNGNYLLRVSALPTNARPIKSEPIELNLSDEPPRAPARPDVTPLKGSVRLKWENQIGANEYKVYRRKKGKQNWTAVYSGRSQGFVDKNAKAATAKFSNPGYKAGASFDMTGIAIYEYCITASDKNGEGPKSEIANTDPRNW
jgi:hypothetical protein